MSAKTNLILAPHHDDAEFGCGGIMARYQGKERFCVAVVFESDYRHRNGTYVTMGQRREESVRSLHSLGLDTRNVVEGGGDVWFTCAAPDNSGMTLLATVAHYARRAIDLYEPTDLYIPLAGFNQDHVALHQAALIALRPVGLYRPQRVWAYEYPGDLFPEYPVPSVGAPRHTRLDPRHLDAKLDALDMHTSQWDDEDFVRGLINPLGARQAATYRGARFGAQGLAETHYLLSEIVW